MKLTAVLTLPGPNFNYEVSEQKLTIHSEVNGHSQFAFSLFHRNLLFSIKKGFTTFLTTLVYWVSKRDKQIRVHYARPECQRSTTSEDQYYDQVAL